MRCDFSRTVKIMKKENSLLIDMYDVHKSYYLSNGIEIPVLKWLKIQVKKWEFVALMWESGWWKSTLLNIIGFLHPMTTGVYKFEGEDISDFKHDDILAFIRNRKIWFIFQQYFLIPRLTALENVWLPWVYAQIDPKERVILARKYLHEVWLSHRESSKPSELSWWEQQRVSIARALINNPDLILADEPTGALDSITAVEIMELIVQLNKIWKTILMVTHTPKMAKYADRVIFLQDGRVMDCDYELEWE